MLSSVNPATGHTLQTYKPHSAADAAVAATHAQQAFQDWSRLGVPQRAAHLIAIAQQLEQQKEALAVLMTAEMGKPIKQSREEVSKCIRNMEYYAVHGPEMLADETVKTDAAESFITYQPLGVVLAVMPWNFPLWQVLRCMAPILLGGNTMLLKHASNVSGCALAIEKAVKDAGVPEGVFTTLLLPSNEVAGLIANPAVAAVTFTGSTAAGTQVAAAAAALVKKQVLELGGSDAYIILEDAELDKAATICAEARLVNTGQSCLAAKRFIVVKEVAEAFTQKFLEALRSKVFGDPMDETNDLGPMARADLRDELHRQVTDSVAKGAVLLCGGFVPESAGAYYPPTLLTNVGKGMPAWEEELFGPVAALCVAQDEADAIRLANNSTYGLGSAVFTQDIARGKRIAAEELQAGNAFVNEQVHSDSRMPFGGIKQSGYGRELGTLGLREFVNVKSVVVG